MHYIVEKHLPGIFNTIDIYDEEGDVVYSFDSHLFLGVRKMSLYDDQEEVVATIEQVLPSFEQRYSVSVAGKLMAYVNKKFAFFEPVVELEMIYDDYKIIGDLIKLEFSIIDDEGYLIAAVSDNLSNTEDTYGVEIDDTIEGELILSILIILDLMLNT